MLSLWNFGNFAIKTSFINICRFLILFDIHLVTLFSLEQNNFFPGTQAFASPPDLASSGVWENIIPSKTPTFDGV